MKLNDKLADNLSNYFDKKQKEFTANSAKAFNKYKSNILKIRQEYSTKKSAKSRKERVRKEKNYQEEYKMNLCEAYRQLGKKGCSNRPQRNLTGRINSLGPKNVDYYVAQSTRNRTTLDYTDPNTGKKAVIKYEPTTVKILNTEIFDKVFVYLIPDKLSSFNRMKSNDKRNYKLNINELLNYKLVCLAYKGEKVYFKELPKVLAQNYDVNLSLSSEEKVRNSLEAQSNLIQKGIESDIDFENTTIAFGKKQKKIKRQKEMTIRMGKFLFPMVGKECLWGYETEIYYGNGGH